MTVSIPVSGQIYLDSTATVEERVQDLLARMTLDEKVGQMTQADRGELTSVDLVKSYLLGSVLSGGGSAPALNTPAGWADMYDAFQAKALETRLKIPIIYGIDAVHGHNNVKGAVIFPHNIGMGCTWDPELVNEAARITALEVAGTGIDWTFAPCIAVPQDERWGRTYEGFGETAEITILMSAAAVAGFQGDTLADMGSIVACAKHFIGDGGTTGGDDQGDTEVDEATLRANGHSADRSILLLESRQAALRRQIEHPERVARKTPPLGRGPPPGDQGLAVATDGHHLESSLWYFGIAAAVLGGIAVPRFPLLVETITIEMQGGLHLHRLARSAIAPGPECDVPLVQRDQGLAVR